MGCVGLHSQSLESDSGVPQNILAKPMLGTWLPHGLLLAKPSFLAGFYSGPCQPSRQCSGSGRGLAAQSSWVEDQQKSLIGTRKNNPKNMYLCQQILRLWDVPLQPFSFIVSSLKHSRGHLHMMSQLQAPEGSAERQHCGHPREHLSHVCAFGICFQLLAVIFCSYQKHRSQNPNVWICVSI